MAKPQNYIGDILPSYTGYSWLSIHIAGVYLLQNFGEIYGQQYERSCTLALFIIPKRRDL